MKSILRNLLDVGSAKQTPRRKRIEFGSNEFKAIYAIGDVHGCLSHLHLAFKAVLNDGRDIPGKKLVVLLGDYVDRGPDSQGVIDFLTSQPPQGFDRVALCGNHDFRFGQFLDAPRSNLSWLGDGGQETLQSYGIDAKHVLQLGGGAQALERSVEEAVPKYHREFLKQLPVMVEVGKLVFVHAGIRPGIPIHLQKDEDLMWIRDPFISLGPQLDRFVIHGHTVSKKPSYGPNRLGIDTGAYATGQLAVLRLKDGKASFLNRGAPVFCSPSAEQV